MSRARWVLVAAMVALVVLAALVVFVARPQPMGETVLDVFDLEGDEEVLVVNLGLESMDANRGTVEVRISAHPGSNPLPPEGAVLFTNIPGLGPLELPATDLISESSTVTLLDGGDVGEYPFDEYTLTVGLALVDKSALTEDADVEALDDLPMAVVATSVLGGFKASVASETQSLTDLRFTMERPTPTVVWAVAMMAIYWLLAIGAVGVALAVVLMLRPFETRHLAWLTALLFAFAAFRNTAPGSPPIGVFLDYGAFFWAVALVVLAELVLLACYLSGSKRGQP